MDGIVFIVGAMILNMFLKSSKDKKRMEEARRKRISESNSSEAGNRGQEPLKEKTKPPSIFEEIITLLNHEVDKKVEKKPSHNTAYKGNEIEKSIRDYKTPKPEKEKWVGSQAKVTESLYKDFDANYYSRDGNKKINEETKIEKETTENQRNKLRKDILNGFIFSEILAKPKSLRKRI